MVNINNSGSDKAGCMFGTKQLTKPVLTYCQLDLLEYFSHIWIKIQNWFVLGFNSLRPSDAIWRQWSWTTLAQVMACCLTAPSHYLNQCWLIIRGVLWHTSESSFAGIAQGIDSGYEFEKYILKNIFKSPRGQWVKCTILSNITEQVEADHIRHRCWSHLWLRGTHLPLHVQGKV